MYRSTKISTEAILRDASELVRIPSVTGDTAAVAAVTAYVRDRLAGWGIGSELHAFPGGEVLDAEVGPASGPTIVLEGHGDVVPADDRAQFEPALAGNRAYGRGFYDMKAAIACMIHAMRMIAVEGSARARLVLVGDEEKPSPPHSISDYAGRRGTGDFVITGEPTDLQVAFQALGAVFIRIRLDGQGGHSAYPEWADDQIDGAERLWQAIRRLPFTQASTRWYRGPAVARTMVSAGDPTRLNVIPASCDLGVSIRYLPGQDGGEILDAVRGLSGVDGLPEFTAQADPPLPPVAVPEDHPYVQLLCDVTRRRYADGGARVVRHGGSDLSQMGPDVLGVEFGPKGAGHHGRGEYVEIDSLLPYTQALIDFAAATNRQ